MPRYEHFLSKVKHAITPKSIYCLSTKCTVGHPKETIESKENKNISVKWAFATVRYVLCRQENLSTGNSRQEFIEALSTMCRSSGINWIVGYGIIQHFTDVGGWQLLESGQLRLGWSTCNGERKGDGIMSEMRVRGSGGSDKQEQQMGGMVQHLRCSGKNADTKERIYGRGFKRIDNTCSPILCDPPTIMHISIPGLPGKLLFLDARNWFSQWNFSSPYPCETACQLAALMQCMFDTCERHKIESYRLTVASQAWHTWRRDYPQHSLLCHTHKGALQLENGALHGGRCEAFVIGREIPDVYHLDFRALYPSCCRNNLLPVRLSGYASTLGGMDTIISNKARNTIAECRVVARRQIYPYRRNGITCFPIGRFRTVLCGPELELAIKRNELYSILAYATYDMEPCLSEWPKRCNTIREEKENDGDDTLALWSKSLCNNLCGRFARRGTYWIRETTEQASLPYGEWYAIDKQGYIVHYRAIAWNVEREVREMWSNDSLPSISAWIMSLARVRLLETMQIAGRRHVFYVDTDSLFVDEIGLKRLQENGMIANKEMGKLQIRGGPHSFYCFGFRHYVYNGKIVRAGFVKPNGREPFKAERNRLAFQPATYKHGAVGNDGWVKPFKLEG